MDSQIRSTLVVAFINLKSRTDNWQNMVMTPLGILYLSAAVKSAFKDRVRVAFHDMTLTFDVERLESNVAEFLAHEKPDVVGLRGFTCHAREYAEIAAVANRECPNAVVIAGGPHASTGSKDLYDNPDIDFVCPSEGEATIVEFIASLLDGRDPKLCPGIAYGVDGAQKFGPHRPLIEKLDDIARPDYSIIDLDRYQCGVTMTGLTKKARHASIFTSRGCHYRCAYCHDNFGKRVRFRSVADVIDEMAYLVEVQGVREIQIIDDLFNADNDRAIRIFEEIDRRGWNIALAFPNGLRGDVMTREFVDAAKAAGTYYIIIAVESATPRIQKLVRKYNKLDRVADAISMCAERSILTATSNMLGFPTETAEEMEATVRFNLESDAHIAWFFLVMPFEGTPLHEIVDEADLPVPTSRQNLGFATFEDDGYAWFTTVSKASIQRKIVETYARFYLDPRRIDRMTSLVDAGYPRSMLTSFFDIRFRAIGQSRESVTDLEVRRSLARLYDYAENDRDLRMSAAATPTPVV